MFQSRWTSLVCAFACTCAFTLAASAQDTKTEPKTQGSGFKLTPNSVVQEEMDDTKLTEKASYLMGFKLIKDLEQQGANVDVEKLFEGMKAAVEERDQRSFITGYQMMKNIKDNGVDLELTNLLEGMKLAKSGKEMGISDPQAQMTMTKFSKMVKEKAIAKVKKQAAENLAAGEAFIAKMVAANPKVKKLDNGVHYEVLVEGTGGKPSREDRVKVDYHGTFIDGTVFDSTVKPSDGRPPAPATFAVAEVVPGFSSAIQAMPVGSKWKIVIPGPLGYGVSGRGQIGPNQTLVFEISLIDVIKKPNPEPAPK